jgi:spermidine synthase
MSSRNATLRHGTRRYSLALGAALLLGSVLLATDTHARVIHTERSPYSTILVNQRGTVVCMLFSVRRDQRNQSCVDQRRPKEMLFPYTRMMMASLLLNPEPEQILMLGLGGGTLPMALDQLLPGTRQDVIEIDPAVTRVAREFFGFAPSDRVNVVTEDGRVFVKRALQRGWRYDLIMLDAFTGEYIPEHLMTREFLEEVRGILSDNGVLVANTFSISDLYSYESATYAAVFAPFFNMKPDDSGNRVILASRQPLPTPDVLAARAAALAGLLRPYGIDFTELLPLLRTEPDWDPDTRVLTDQYAPANLLRRR